jgi:hypothetical protein
MKRREFIFPVGVAAACSFSAHAQEPERINAFMVPWLSCQPDTDLSNDTAGDFPALRSYWWWGKDGWNRQRVYASRLHMGVRVYARNSCGDRG